MRTAIRFISAFSLLLLLLAFAGRQAEAVPLTFAGSWIAEGDVTFDTSPSPLYAQLGDNTYATLYQEVSVTQNALYTLSFDFKTSIDSVTGGSFSDLFSATIYRGFAFSSEYDALFDINAGIETLYDGDLGGTANSEGYRSFSYTFVAGSDLLYPTFELYDLDQSPGSSALIANVRLDEVTSTPVPEPSTLLLLAGGGTLLAVARIRRRS